MSRLRYLLLQTRNANDPMRAQEVACFALALDCAPADIGVFDLLAAAPTIGRLKQSDMILLGGSGHYSAADIPAPRTADEREHPPTGFERDTWLNATLDALREIHDRGIPTFASCWGFQAMARAMGGRCIHDLPNAELGTIEMRLTPAGQSDPVFGQLPIQFTGQAGHEDHVVALPPDAMLLASSNRIAEQAYHFVGKPIYCTQFHPELDRASLLERVRAYPEYVERIAGMAYDEFVANCQETPEANSLLRRFVKHVF